MMRAGKISFEQPKVASRPQKIFLWSLAAILLVTVSTLHAFQGKSGIGGEEGNANAAYAIGLWGDLPLFGYTGYGGCSKSDRRHEQPEAGFHCP